MPYCDNVGYYKTRKFNNITLFTISQYFVPLTLPVFSIFESNLATLFSGTSPTLPSQHISQGQFLQILALPHWSVTQCSN